MELPPFLTNKQDIGPTLALGFCIGELAGKGLEGAIAAVVVRALQYYCGWGATIGAFLSLGSSKEAESQDRKINPIIGAIALGAIGYGVERVVRHLFFK